MKFKLPHWLHLGAHDMKRNPRTKFVETDDPSAFTLPELLVVIVILAIIGSVGILSFFFLVRRARVQSVALETAGWIENIRNASADRIVPTAPGEDPVQGGCEIQFPAGNSSYVAGATLARVVPLNCAPEQLLRIPEGIRPDEVIIAGTKTIVFTPRGLWIETTGEPGDEFRLSITLDPGGPERCVRLTPVLGSVEIGRPRAGSGACDPGAEWLTL